VTADRSGEAPFRLEEATIDNLHAAIRAGETTCAGVVAHYIERVRAFNGAASLLVRCDGVPVAPRCGPGKAPVGVREGQRMLFRLLNASPTENEARLGARRKSAATPTAKHPRSASYHLGIASVSSSGAAIAF
jgi:hypothetical protein